MKQRDPLEPILILGLIATTLAWVGAVFWDRF